MGLKPSATSFRPASSASVCVSSASRADGWMASAMAFMVVAIVLVFCLRSVRCRASVQLGRARWPFVGARRWRSVVRAASASRSAPRALGRRDAIFGRGYLLAPCAGAFTQPSFARSEGMGSGCCARARAGFGASGDGRGAARLSVDGLASLARNYVADASSGNSIFNLRLVPLAASGRPPLPPRSP